MSKNKQTKENLGQNKQKKRKLEPYKSWCCHRHHRAIKGESSTITAAAESLQRGSDNGPEGKRQRARGTRIVRKTDKKTEEQVIS